MLNVSYIGRMSKRQAMLPHVMRGKSPDQKLHHFLSRAILVLNCVAVLAICLTLRPSVAMADDVPAFDISKTCKVDSSAYPMPGGAAGCLNDEQSAKRVLGASWANFDEQSRRDCIQMVGDVAGTQSYVELLTCLQVAAAARKLPDR